jgi:glutamine---fructose-6-phosphate transaminase (isomerizing)
MYVPGAGRSPGREHLALPVQELLRIPGKLETVLAHDAVYENWRASFPRHRFPVPRPRRAFPIALEGALKLKEISYIHAEGYPAGEMKHGPNALIDEKLPVVVLATRDPTERREPPAVREDALEYSGSEGARRHRGGAGDRGRQQVRKMADHVIEIPPRRDLLAPILEIVPLQLLAYHIAVRRGCDVDQPRNLAKSVTVAVVTLSKGRTTCPPTSAPRSR